MVGLVLLVPFVFVIVILFVILFFAGKQPVQRKPVGWRWGCVTLVVLGLLAGTGVVLGDLRGAVAFGVPLLFGVIGGFRAWNRAAIRRAASQPASGRGMMCYHWADNRPCAALATHAIYRPGDGTPLAWYCSDHIGGEYGKLVRARPEQEYQVRPLSE